MEESHFLQWSLFLLALATGCSASQLAVLKCHPSFTRVEGDYSTLMLIPSPTFLPKNERTDEMICPLTVLSFLEGTTPTRCAQSRRSRIV